MIGRAGRPQFDTEGVAVIMTQKDVSNLWHAIFHSIACKESALVSYHDSKRRE